MIDLGSTQVLQQTTYLSHDVDSDKFNSSTEHTNVVLVLMDNIFIDLSRGVNLFVETWWMYTPTLPVLK